MTKKVGGWQTTTSTVVYENSWINVRHDEVITPAGTDGIYGVVHFKNKAIGVVAIDDEQHIFLVKQSRYALDAFTWEIPEGGCPHDEEPLDAAKRELEEEVGVVAAEWYALMTMHLSNSVSDEIAYIFVAKTLSQGVQQLESTEDIVVKRMPFSEALAMVLRGEITDSISVAAILRVALDINRPLSV